MYYNASILDFIYHTQQIHCDAYAPKFSSVCFKLRLDTWNRNCIFAQCPLDRNLKLDFGSLSSKSFLAMTSSVLRSGVIHERVVFMDYHYVVDYANCIFQLRAVLIRKLESDPLESDFSMKKDNLKEQIEETVTVTV